MNPERFSWIESAMKRPGTWGMLITVTTLGSLLLIAFSMSVGVSGVVNHLLYIPIIITAYAYPRRGALFALGLASTYLALVFLFRSSYPADLIAAMARFYVYVLVGVVVSYLSLRLKREEQKYHRIFEFSYTGIVLLDPATYRIQQANHHMEEIFGFSADELKGLTIYDLVCDQDRPVLGPALAAMRQQPDSQRSFELMAGTKEGETISVSLSLTEVPDERGDAEFMVALFQDISERKRAEQLRHQQDASIRASIDGVVLLDPSLTITFANDAFTRMFACRRPASLAGKPWISILDAKERARISMEIVPALRSKRQWRGEITGLRDDRSPISLELSAAVIEGGGTVCIVRDITDRKLTEQALQQVNRKLNLLASVTRHDIRNQLFILLGYLHMTRDRVTDPEVLDLIRKEEQAARTISGHIEFTKNYQDMGIQSPAWQDVDLVFLYAISHLDAQALGRSIDVNDLQVFADPFLEKVFQTLVDNTLRHGGNATRYALTSRQEPAAMVLVYEDDGQGIPADRKEAIFEPAPGQKGGLGLFLAREVLSITGISIRETGEEGKGARFEMTIPEGRYRSGSGADGGAAA